MKPQPKWTGAALLVSALGLLALNFSCGLGAGKQDICNCVPLEPPVADYRHLAKHVPLPNGTPQEITVATMLTWPQDIIPLPPEAPRAGREVQLFHIARAFLQYVHVNPEDCDISMEISDTPEVTAPRVVVETPVDSEFCSARQQLQAQLQQHGFTLDNQHGGIVPTPFAIEVLGLAFEDFEHNRGAVATVWELHPAIVSLTK